MKLYSLNYRGPFTNGEWSIVTIYKTLESAKTAYDKYNKDYRLKKDNAEYIIYVIDIDTDSDIIFEYTDIDIEENNKNIIK